MAVLTIIAGVPLFSTLEEALSWAASRGLNGHHIHVYRGQRGYMGGANHQQATQPPAINRPRPSSRSTSGSGGGGGY